VVCMLAVLEFCGALRVQPQCLLNASQLFCLRMRETSLHGNSTKKYELSSMTDFSREWKKPHEHFHGYQNRLSSTQEPLWILRYSN